MGIRGIHTDSIVFDCVHVGVSQVSGVLPMACATAQVQERFEAPEFLQDPLNKAGKPLFHGFLRESKQSKHAGDIWR